MQDTDISLAHGNGGRLMRELIEDVFARHLANPGLDTHCDAVPLALAEGEVLFTTDGFTVQPLEFPGGNIGSLAVHGTTNDLAVAGAWLQPVSACAHEAFIWGLTPSEQGTVSWSAARSEITASPCCWRGNSSACAVICSRTRAVCCH